MDPCVDLMILADALKQKGAKQFAWHRDDAALGICSGSHPAKHKQWINEDAIALHLLPDGAYLAAVADAHFGGQASNHLIAATRAAFMATAGSIQARLCQVVMRLNQELVEHDALGQSASTYLLVHLAGSTLTFASVGDSVLFLLQDGQAQRINQPQFTFLPHRYPLAADAFPWSQGQHTVPDGAIALLATDGIERNCSGLTDEDIAAHFAAAGTLSSQVFHLIYKADTVAKGGGKDNLGVIALAPSS